MNYNKDLPEILATDFTRKWDDFCIASDRAKITILQDQEFLTEMKQVFTFSDFVAVSCTRNPEMISGLIENGDLYQQYSSDTYSDKLKITLAGIKKDLELERTLRLFRTREMVRIAWRDLTGLAGLSETMSDLSALADACIDHTLSILYDRLCIEFGIPTGSGDLPLRLVVIGMGKLGGHELNFSSDVDLIFAFAEQGKTSQGPMQDQCPLAGARRSGGPNDGGFGAGHGPARRLPAHRRPARHDPLLMAWPYHRLDGD